MQNKKEPFNTISGLALLEKYPTAHHYKHSSVDRIMKIFSHIQGNNFNKDKALRLLELSKESIYSGKAKDARAIAIRSTVRLLKMYLNEIDIIEAEILSLLDKKGVNSTTLDELPTKGSLIDNLKTIPGVSDKTCLISKCCKLFDT